MAWLFGIRLATLLMFNYLHTCIVQLYRLILFNVQWLFEFNNNVMWKKVPGYITWYYAHIGYSLFVPVKHAHAISSIHTLIAVSTYLSFFTSCYQSTVTYSHKSSFGVIRRPLGVPRPEELVPTPKPENRPSIKKWNYVHEYHDNNIRMTSQVAANTS